MCEISFQNPFDPSSAAIGQTDAPKDVGKERIPRTGFRRWEILRRDSRNKSARTGDFQSVIEHAHRDGALASVIPVAESIDEGFAKGSLGAFNCI